MLFSKKLAPEEKIPILNKPPSNPPLSTTVEPTTSTANEQQQENNLKSNEKKRQKRPRKYIPKETYNYYVEFQAYEHFAISRGTIREICGQGDCCDVYILFEEAMKKIPKIGISCLSYEDLWKEQVELQGPEATTSKLDFIKMIPFEHDDTGIPQNKLASISPRKHQTFIITLSIADERGVKVRFSFMRERPSCWHFIRYPLLMDDYSFIIEIEKKELLTMDSKKSKLEILTTYGWLQRRAEQPNQKEESNTADESLEKQLDEDDIDCYICYDKGIDALFYPCSHSVVHRKCLPKNPETGEFVKECYTCKQIYEKLVTLQFPYNECKFCCPGQCFKFDSYCYPCGCSLGCIKGFKRNAYQMSLNCTACGRIIENIQPFYRA